MKIDRKIAFKIARYSTKGQYDKIVDILEQLPNTDKVGTWGFYAQKFIPFLKDTSTPAPFTIFAKGNSKLPFYSFSNLPVVNCPGAGECAKWCYSLKAWRYPAAFFRQVQNTILVKELSPQIVRAWKSLPENRDVRLYVDGDFDSLETMSFWFTLMNERKDLNVYGYSKSWQIFLDYASIDGATFPKNYTLNMSSGSKYENIGPIRAAMSALPIVRGNFVAVEAGKKPTPKTVREVAKSFGMKNIFVCPGKCGSCMKVKGKNVHACGALNLMKDTNVVIGTH